PSLGLARVLSVRHSIRNRGCCAGNDRCSSSCPCRRPDESSSSHHDKPLLSCGGDRSKFCTMRSDWCVSAVEGVRGKARTRISSTSPLYGLYGFCAAARICVIVGIFSTGGCALLKLLMKA